jgi:V/A-type H+-transporting ATPase subunit I
MSKVQIVGSRRIMEEVIELLHSLSILHIEGVPEDIKEDLASRVVPLQKEELALKERAEKMLRKVGDLILLLYRPPVSIYPLPEWKMEKFSVTDIVSEKFLSDFDALEDRLRGLHKKKSEIAEGLSLIARYERILKGLAPLISKLSDLKAIEFTGVIVDKDKAGVIPLLEAEIRRITDGMYQIFRKELDGESIGVIIAYQKDYDMKVRSLLSKEGISEIKLPAEYTGLPLFDALKMMIRKKGEITLEIKEIERELDKISEEWYWKVEGFMGVLKDLVDEFKTLSYCKVTKYSFFITGWTPQRDIPRLRDTIKDKFGERALMRELEIRKEDLERIPVSIRNPAIVKPFEIFMSILPPPRYDSIDPTPFLAIFFPLFFGLILGDSGHGLILLLCALILRIKFSKSAIIQDITKVIFLCAIYSIIFGFLFGEFFGMFGERFGMHPILFDRSKTIKGFLLIAIAIGVGHIMLGFVLSLLNSIKWKRKKEAIGKISSILMVFAILLAIASAADYLPRGFLFFGIILSIAVIPVILIFEGLIGIIEVIRSLSNIVSYTRIMALGTAAVMMSLVANKVGEMSGNIIIGIIIAGLIHVLNIIIGVFSPTIQALRLHYVEFFSKFYKEGNRRYIPFRKTRGEVRLWRRV